MIGFKKVPRKAISIIFFISIVLILLLYNDVETYDTLPVEEIEISEDIQEQLPEMPTYMMHEVQDGENLSIIFEEFKVPLNTAYKIFRLDSQNLLSKIKPGDEMRFSYLEDKITSIEIMKDKINSLLININNDISIQKIEKNVEILPKLGNPSFF
mgnify:CR=1 FL=1